jgi:uncharacterized membrane protein YGL010W
MRALAKNLAIYKSFHTKLITEITHYIGIPLIIFSLMILFSWVHVKVPNFFDTTLAWLFLALAIIYYLFLDLVIGATLSVILIILNFIAGYITHNEPSWHSFKIFIIIFVIGIIFIALGHLFESRKPALMSNLKYALIGPIYLTAEFFFCLGFKKDLQQKMMEKN